MEKLRPVIFSKWIKALLGNSVVLWNALGVPISQAKMFLEETTTADYLTDTLDPVAFNTHIATGAYHYQVCLEQKYTKSSCPLYLTRDGFEFLKKNEGEAMNTFRLHTESIINVLKQLGKNSLTVLVLMDAQDWFSNSLSQSAQEIEDSPCDLTLTIRAVHNSLPRGGRVFWRSSAMFPWYEALYRREGFSVERLQVREIGSKIPIDRVQMYASLWKAVKL